ncbi:MAG: amidophosphoribosyltransferase [Planctomycetota bacterium]|nr:MAG: amidophosphoribosyltransferase [Planctomycetota bacterium]
MLPRPPRAGARCAPRAAGASEKKEKCGVFGVWGEPTGVRLAYYGLFAQQHRGQESAGIAVSDGSTVVGHCGMGLVPEVFSERILWELEHRPERRRARENGSAAPAVRGAIGHNRYSTTGSSVASNCQPIIESYIGGQVAVAHNGNLINAAAVRDAFEAQGHIFHTTSDTEVIVHLLASPDQQASRDPLASTLRRLQGAFSLVFLFPDRIEAARDPWGWRPLVLGRTPAGRPVVASETVALDAIGASFDREVEPGEIVTLSDAGVTSRRFAEPAARRAHCVFEHVYFANPSSRLYGQAVQVVRERLGERLAAEAPAAADYVMPMPDSGRSAANGYARASGVPYREGIVPNRYVGRTFIKPTQDERDNAVRLKLNIVGEIVRGKRLVVVDDSIVRGTTTRTKMKQLRDAGAKEIHLRISCPPIAHPCFFGIDFAEPEQLIAHGRTVEQIREFLGVDTLHFLSLEGLLACAATEATPGDDFCTACFSGDYPIDVEHPQAKGILERRQMKMFSPNG